VQLLPARMFAPFVQVLEETEKSPEFVPVIVTFEERINVADPLFVSVTV
jgi:hypothetical protein